MRAPACGHADVWTAVPESVGADELAGLTRLLSRDELARVSGFAIEPARQRFIVTRALLRLSLSRYADIAPEAWVFARGSHGKPRLDGAQAALGLCFNVSHSAGMAAVAIASSDVGIDVQDTTRTPPARVRERYLAPAEREGLSKLPESERAARFFEHWTLKEAYVKARGLGFSLPLGQIGFQLRPSGIRLSLGPGCPDDGRSFWLKTWRVSGEHLMALALAQPAAGAPSSLVPAARGLPAVLASPGDGLPIVQVELGLQGLPVRLTAAPRSRTSKAP
jgi:4'-phosphopantetheinyl transferase